MEEFLNLTFGQLISGTAGIAIVVSMFFEFSKIKLNPISSLLAWLGSKTNAPIMTKVKDLEEQVCALAKDINDMRERSEEQEAINCRVRILRFADELRWSKRRSLDSFKQILLDVDQYEKYCLSHPDFKNSITLMADKLIRDTYEVCLAQDDFLD